MNMHWLDWGILAGLAVGITCLSVYTQRYTRSVADFLAANRCAGKYVLGVADGIAGLCAISIVALFEMYYKAGFTAVWWQTMMMPVTIVIAISGWVQYRYRQTRAMTMAQFFELRYSRRFRVFAGLLAFVSGTINFGIFPAVAGRFFQYYCGFPTHFVQLGAFQIDLVYGGIMFAMVGFALMFTVLGGQIVVMVTDFVQGTLVNVFFVVLAVYLLLEIDWTHVAAAIASAPKDASLVNPLATAETDNFNVTYFLIQLFGTFFTFMAWQGNQGYYGAAKTPHDARMGRVIGSYRAVVQGLPLVLLPIWAYTFYHHPAYADGAAQANAVLATTGSAQLQTQLAVTVALPHLLPIGLMGCFAAIMLAAFVTTHDTYLHSWGSIFVQDVVLPIRSSLFGAKATLSPEKHLLWLRLSITGVAVFIFLFSLLFNQQQDILMYFALTGTIYLGWAGAAIVGGLYWKRGTTAGAWTAAVLGMVLAVVGWYMTYFWPSFQSIAVQLTPGLWDAACGGWAALAGDKCPITAQVLWFYTMLASALGYVVVSLCTQPKKAYDVDRLLHRGKHIGASGKEQYDEDVPTGLRALAMGKEYTFGDKCIVVFSYAYSLVFFAIFLFGTLYAMKYTVTDATWLTIWRGYGWLMLVLMILITTWMAVGGCRDLVALFRELGSMRRDERDDGSVIGHLNFDETEKDGHE